LSRARAAHTTTPTRSAPNWKSASSSGCASPWTSRASTPAPPPSPAILAESHTSPKCLRCPLFGGSCAAAASWPHSRTTGPTPHGNASKPNCPTSSGRPMSPTGTWPTAPTWEILNLLDDHSRLALASHSRTAATGYASVSTGQHLRGRGHRPRRRKVDQPPLVRPNGRQHSRSHEREDKRDGNRSPPSTGRCSRTLPSSASAVRPQACSARN
jgi:hypothetical protein